MAQDWIPGTKISSREKQDCIGTASDTKISSREKAAVHKGVYPVVLVPAIRPEFSASYSGTRTSSVLPVASNDQGIAFVGVGGNA